jgi:DNA-binding IclR family transcriptional regulator
VSATRTSSEERGTSLRRGLALLLALGSTETTAAGGAGVSQLAAVTGQDKSQVSRSLRTLAEAGLIDRDPVTRMYRIGWQLYVLAARAGDARLLALAAPLLVRIVEQTGERSHLSVARGTGVLTLLTESAPHAVQTVSWVGRITPVHATSSGRALLLDHDRPALLALLGDGALDRPGPRAPADVDQLWARIQAARRQGVVVVDEEFEPGLLAVAAPVRDVTGRIVAALNISAPRFRLVDGLEAACAVVLAAAAELSVHLGGSPATATTDLRTV